MKVYACLNCFYNGADMWVTLERVVATEEQAQRWVSAILHTESIWRDYEEYKVEGAS